MFVKPTFESTSMTSMAVVYINIIHVYGSKCINMVH